METTRRLPARSGFPEPVLRLGVPTLLVIEVELRPGRARGGRELLRELDALDEARARRPQGELRVDVDETRDVDDGEEKVTELGEDARIGLGLGRRSARAPVTFSR